MQRVNGFVEKGVTTIAINGVTSAANVQRCYPSATVTVYNAGTVNLATIYSDNASTPKANPFTASADASWFFYAADGRYDVKFSGGGITSPWTQADVLLDDATVSSFPVSSVFGRTGAVVALSGDYSFAMISGTASAAQLPTAGGDLSGTLSNATVAKLQNRTLVSTAPSDGQAIVWVAGSSQWGPGSPSSVIYHYNMSGLAYESAGHTNFASISSSQTLYNKTLSGPYISNFANATHAHQSAGGGGLLAAAAISGSVPATGGGTGQTSYTKGDLLVATGASVLAKLNVGSDGQILMADSTLVPGVGWKSAAAATAHNILSLTHGDTLAGSATRGDLIVANSTPKWSRLPVGSTRKLLQSDGSDAGWGLPLVHKPVTLSFSTPLTTDATTGSLFRCTLTSDFTLSNPTGAVDGQVLMWEFIQSGSGSALTLDTKFVVSDAFNMVLSKSAGARDFLEVLYCSSPDKFYVTRFVRQSTAILVALSDSMTGWADGVSYAMTSA